MTNKYLAWLLCGECFVTFLINATKVNNSLDYAIRHRGDAYKRPLLLCRK